MSTTNVGHTALWNKSSAVYRRHRVTPLAGICKNPTREPYHTSLRFVLTSVCRNSQLHSTYCRSSRWHCNYLLSKTKTTKPRKVDTMAPTSLSDLKRKDLFQTKGYINAEWVRAKSGKTFDVVDPATLETIATIPEMGAAACSRSRTRGFPVIQENNSTSESPNA
jgi:hypothetical protein